MLKPKTIESETKFKSMLAKKTEFDLQMIKRYSKRREAERGEGSGSEERGGRRGEAARETKQRGDGRAESLSLSLSKGKMSWGFGSSAAKVQWVWQAPPRTGSVEFPTDIRGA